ncbi:MAG: helix-turn-helix transcriptional regulator [Treponema sp.]|nr:helix-turn-helix transcriptional regulator [Treponema sp.]
MSSIFDDFRMNLKFYREKLSFSQSDLAVQADCSNALIGNIEAGRVKPSFDAIVKFSEALKVHPADLFLRGTSKQNSEIREELKAGINSIIDKIISN